MLTLLVVMALVDGAFRRQIQTDLEGNLDFARQVALGAWSAEMRAQVDASAAYALDPRLRAAVATDDRATIQQTLSEVFQTAPHSWAAVLTPAGTRMAATAGAPTQALAAADPLLSEARFFDTGDLRSRGGHLEVVGVSAVLFGADPLAILVAGHRVNEADLSALEDAAGRPVVLVGPTTPVAGSEALASGLAPDLLDEMAAPSETTPTPGGASTPEGASTPAAPVRAIAGDEARFLATAAPLTSPTQGQLGSLVLFDSLDAALAPADALRARLLLILVLGLLLTLGVGALFSRGITVPIARLLTDTERLASGDLERPIEPMRDDEIGRLAAAFEEMRASLKGARAELLRAERLGAIGQAASAVAHDFTQPLSTISGAVGLLRMGVASDEDREQCFDAIEGQIDRLGRMKEEIVDFARGKRDFEGAWIRFDSFLENTVSGLKSDLAARNIELKVEHGYDGEWWIDAYRLGRVVENLVRNAGASGAEQVVVRSWHREGVLMMEVEDDGSGIPTDLLDTVFEPFVTSGKKEGTGLGLAIARNVVVEHGGTIEVDSSPDGTAFTMRLPTVQSREATEAAAERPPAPASPPASAEARRRPSRGLVGTCIVGLAAALAPSVTAPPLHAQIPLDLSGQIDLVAAQPDEGGLNDAFRGDSPFNPVRLRLYARSWITERIGVFSELLYDTDSKLRVNGAYMLINEIADRPWLSARIGLAPNIIGGFGLRSTYFNANPLIGVPLAWQYFTDLSKSGTQTASDLLARAPGTGTGVPLLYDACWNIQYEILGESGLFEYSLGLTPGSLSNPSGAQDADGTQLLGRLGATLRPGIRLGLSAGHGPYLSPLPDDGPAPYPGSPADYDQTLVGLDLEVMSGPWAIFAEAYRSSWEAPLIAGSLEATGGFAEVRYDVAPGWHVAGRIGALLFSDVTDGSVSGPWDDDVVRYEAAVGYRLAREVLLTVDWQRTATRGEGFAQNLLSAQLSAVF